MDRRDFLKRLSAATATMGLAACTSDEKTKEIIGTESKKPTGEMTYRTVPTSGDKVSLLGYGCMRLPTVQHGSAREQKDIEIDQEELNAHVDYAIAHGINYFDTSPVYCQGRSEHHMGIALKRIPRDKYFIATKLSNFAQEFWSREASIKMYHNSFKELQVDTIDYMLLHSIGGTNGEYNSTQTFEKRYIENGILDFLLEERAKGKIRNLGFSYHGDIAIFDRALAMHDKCKWDFVQIQMNYVDWLHAKEVNPANTNAEYLYAELEKRNIPAIIMEPLLGGRLASTLSFIAAKLKARRPEDSIAKWALRYLGSFPNVLTVLSGMTYMENVKENIDTYSPVEPCTEEELALLEEVAQAMLRYPSVPCTGCQYCMPCPYGINIPGIFQHYNKCINEGNVSISSQDENYAEARRAFLMGYDRTVPKLRQANHCIGCGMCKSHCPQNIDIPKEMQRIDKYVESLKQSMD